MTELIEGVETKRKVRDLRAKIVRVFALQFLLISVATLAGIYATNTIVKDVLMRGALNGEAEHYWRLFDQDPSQPLPNTNNMTGYLALNNDLSAVPEAVRSVGTDVGYHRAKFHDQEQIVHVSERDGARLFLVFSSDGVTDLAFFFGIVPLSIVLLLVYGLMWVTYRMSQQAVSPVVRLAQQLEAFRIGSGSLDLGDLREEPDPEVVAMVEALDHYVQRVAAFVERERNFTRYASHELRTPVAVFKGSLDLLEKNQERSKAEKNAIARMRKTVLDMEGLIETLLMLAREQMPQSENVNVNDIVAHQIEVLDGLIQSRSNRVEVVAENTLMIDAPPRVVQIILTNLLRNASTYTDAGVITVEIDQRSVTVADTGVGMNQEQLDHAFSPFYRSEEARQRGPGYGLGLAIVKRLADQYSWHIVASSEPEQGTRIRVVFSN